MCCPACRNASGRCWNYVLAWEMATLERWKKWVANSGSPAKEFGKSKPKPCEKCAILHAFANCTGSWKSSTSTNRNDHYQSRPGLYVTGELCRPSKVAAGERLPAILYGFC